MAFGPEDDNESGMSQEVADLYKNIAAELETEDGSGDYQEERPIRKAHPREETEPVYEEESAGDQGEGGQEADPYAGMPEGIRTQLDGILARLSTIDHIDQRLQQAENRIGAVTNKLSSIPKAPEPPTEEEILAALGTDAGLDEFYDEYLPAPYAKALRERERKLISALRQPGTPAVDIQQLRSEIVADVQEGFEQKTFSNNMALLKTFYPNHVDIVKNEGFKSWFKTQPADRQELYNMNPLDGLKLLRFYDQHLTEEAGSPNIEEQREKRLESGAADVRLKRKPIRKKAESDMNQEELYNHYAREIWQDEA